MKLCQEVGGARLSDIAKEFQIDHYLAVSQTISRLNGQLKDDSGIRQIFNVLSPDLTPPVLLSIGKINHLLINNSCL